MKILVLAFLLGLVLDVKALFRPRFANIGSLGSNILLIPVDVTHSLNPMLPISGNQYYPVQIQPGYPIQYWNPNGPTQPEYPDRQWYPNAVAATEPWSPNAGYPNAPAPTQPSDGSEPNPAINGAGGGGTGGSLATHNGVSAGASGHEAGTVEEYIYQNNR